MLVLGKEELKQAEKALVLFLPESIKVYGCVFNINRGKPHNLEVITDFWPDFKTIVCKPKIQGTQDREGDFNIYSIYSKDKDSLKKLLSAFGVVNWNVFTLFAGVDINHLDAVKELAAHNNVPSRTQLVTMVLTLEDSSRLHVQKSDSGCTVHPLTAAHAELVNSCWKHGGDRNSYNSVLSYISNYPCLCVMEEGGTRPVSWLLLYQHGALGLLYTLPEHRRRGYARLLVSVMAEHLLQQGHPVYCFVEQDNDASYRLFTSLGFTHKRSYQSVWFELNKRKVE